METKTCPKFLTSPIFYNMKRPTSVTKNEFLKTYLTFFQIQIHFKVNEVFYKIIKNASRKNKI